MVRAKKEEREKEKKNNKYLRRSHGCVMEDVR